jgi:hypothetical protein
MIVTILYMLVFLSILVTVVENELELQTKHNVRHDRSRRLPENLMEGGVGPTAVLYTTVNRSIYRSVMAIRTVQPSAFHRYGFNFINALLPFHKTSNKPSNST